MGELTAASACVKHASLTTKAVEHLLSVHKAPGFNSSLPKPKAPKPNIYLSYDLTIPLLPKGTENSVFPQTLVLEFTTLTKLDAIPNRKQAK